MNLDLARQTSRYLGLAQAQLNPAEGDYSPLEEESRARAGLWYLSWAWRGFLAEVVDAYALKATEDELHAYVVSPAKGSLHCSALEQLQELYSQRHWLYALLNASQALQNNIYSFKAKAARAVVSRVDIGIALSDTDKLESSHSIRLCFAELRDLIEQHRSLHQEY